MSVANLIPALFVSFHPIDLMELTIFVVMIWKTNSLIQGKRRAGFFRGTTTWEKTEPFLTWQTSTMMSFHTFTVVDTIITASKKTTLTLKMFVINSLNTESQVPVWTMTPLDLVSIQFCIAIKYLIFFKNFTEDSPYKPPFSLIYHSKWNIPYKYEA